MLTGHEIKRRVLDGRIKIEPFNNSQLNPNSYNLKLGENLKIYDTTKGQVIDCKKSYNTIDIVIPDEGYILHPGTLYLGETVEVAGAYDCIPCIDGRSSIARNGISIHVTAGFGDIGFIGKWTLEITVTHPVRIYKDMEIGQVYFYEPIGEIHDVYNGKYQNQSGVTASKLSEDFTKESNYISAESSYINNLHDICKGDINIYRYDTDDSFINFIEKIIYERDYTINVNDMNICVFHRNTQDLIHLQDICNNVLLVSTNNQIIDISDVELHLVTDYKLDINKTILIFEDEFMIESVDDNIDAFKYLKAMGLRHNINSIIYNKSNEKHIIYYADLNVDVIYGKDKIEDKVIVSLENISEIIDDAKSLVDKLPGFVTAEIIYDNEIIQSGICKSLIDSAAMITATRKHINQVMKTNVNFKDDYVLIIKRNDFDLDYLTVIKPILEENKININIANIEPNKSTLEDLYLCAIKEFHKKPAIIKLIDNLNGYEDYIENSDIYDAFSKKYHVIIDIIYISDKSRDEIITDFSDTKVHHLSLINQEDRIEKIILNENEE